MDVELIRCIEDINTANRILDQARASAIKNHPRIAGRLSIVKEELLLIGVIAEHEAGMLGHRNEVSDTEPPESTQTDLEIPTY